MSKTMSMSINTNKYKYERIDNQKIELKNLINTIDSVINNNNIEIELEDKKHSLFLNTINNLKIIKCYNFNSMKDRYKLIKKEITKIKQNYKKIIKIYGLTISYHTDQEIIKYNKNIQNTKDNIFIMLVNFNQLKLKYTNSVYRYKSVILNNDYLKIPENTDVIDNIDKIENIIIELNKKHNEIEQIKNLLKKHKLEQIKLLDIFI